LPQLLKIPAGQIFAEVLPCTKPTKTFLRLHANPAFLNQPGWVYWVVHYLILSSPLAEYIGPAWSISPCYSLSYFITARYSPLMRFPLIIIGGYF
jgi:hypothetical protein